MGRVVNRPDRALVMLSTVTRKSSPPLPSTSSPPRSACDSPCRRRPWMRAPRPKPEPSSEGRRRKELSSPLASLAPRCSMRSATAAGRKSLWQHAHTRTLIHAHTRTHSYECVCVHLNNHREARDQKRAGQAHHEPTTRTRRAVATAESKANRVHFLPRHMRMHTKMPLAPTRLCSPDRQPCRPTANEHAHPQRHGAPAACLSLEDTTARQRQAPPPRHTVQDQATNRTFMLRIASATLIVHRSRGALISID